MKTVTRPHRVRYEAIENMKGSIKQFHRDGAVSDAVTRLRPGFAITLDRELARCSLPGRDPVELHVARKCNRDLCSLGLRRALRYCLRLAGNAWPRAVRTDAKAAARHCIA